MYVSGAHPKQWCISLCAHQQVKLFLCFIIAVGAGTNKQFIATKNTAKLDRESEELKHDKIPLDVGKIIQQGRNAKGLSQKDLATVRFLNFRLA